MSRPAVSAFRGPPPTGRDGAAAGLPPAAPALPDSPAPARPLLDPVLARAIVFTALVAFGAMHWMRMLEPPAPERGWYALAGALLAGLGLLGAARLGGLMRAVAVAAALLAALAVAVTGAGADDRLLLPGQWDELAAGVARGVDSLRGARVPYRGLDEWLRLVIPLGGTLLAVLAAALAFWPRRGGRTGFQIPALVALVALYAVPAVALIFTSEFVRGALLAVLVVAFLRLERLRRRDAGAAGAVAAVTVVLALMLAPALDGIDPWWDYETWALSQGGSKSTTFSWDHDYGPLRWPRDGRELLRVKSPQRTYWKADQLDLFDGERWQQVQDAGALREAPAVLLDGVEFANLERWTFDMTVGIRNLRTETFVTAGVPVEEGVQMPRRPAVPTERAGILRTTRTLHRGDIYRATVYLPRPSDRELRRATATNYAAYELDRYTELMVDGFDGGGLTARDRGRVSFPAFKGDPVVLFEQVDAQQLLAGSALRRSWELAQRLRAGADSPYEYVLAIERHLSRGFGYAEEPPPGSETLDGFLFDTKVGYCQQFSGAMALLLRMGGVPARVATGFSPGSYDEDTKEYVVRDLDAHSWVEVWFGGIGWVPFDPTPTTAPPRSQAADETSASAAIGDIADLGTATFDPRRDGEAARDPRPWGLYLAIVLGLVGTVAGARALARRRRRTPAGLELERALRIVEGPASGVTLSALEARFAASPGAAGYVRALRAQRYARAAQGPTRRQRRGLRRALARGRGLGGRLRAWWALPPRLFG